MGIRVRVRRMSVAAKKRWRLRANRERASATAKALLKPKTAVGLLPTQARHLDRLLRQRDVALISFLPHPAPRAWGREHTWLISATDPDLAGAAERFLRCLELSGIKNVALYTYPARKGAGALINCIAQLHP